MLTIDFETQAIEPRPNFPPEPVGLAIADGRTRSVYMSWGHPDGNSHDSHTPAQRLLRLALGNEPVLMHNAAFDLAVAHERWGLSLPAGSQVHDTMFLAFLVNPYGELGLKPLAQKYLQMPPEERDAVRDWLVEHKVITKKQKPGAHIAKATARVVELYAIGDVERTRRLFEVLYPLVQDAKMTGAYDRERDLLPMLLENSALGVPLDRKRLASDAKRYEEMFRQCERQLRHWWPDEIGSTPPENFSGDELAEQLVRGGINLPKTPSGKVSTAKDKLLAALPEGRVRALLLYRSAMEKSLSTYIRPWLEQGDALHCQWNQVRDFEDRGARTGRLSSSPNLQNVTSPEKYAEVLAVLKSAGFDKFELPNLRSYIVPPEGEVLFGIDYSQQELRMLAHFEDDQLCAAYNADPNLDIHNYVRELIRKMMARDVERRATKAINFGKVYGQGITALAASLGISVEEATELVSAYDQALPGVRSMQRETSNIARRGGWVTTLGGRRYSAPPPAVIDGTLRTFEYRVLNYLIQGSSADQTKEAMRQWWRYIVRARRSRFLLTVHDEIVGSCKVKHLDSEIARLRDCMVGAFALDVPVVVDVSVGTNYGAMAKLK